MEEKVNNDTKIDPVILNNKSHFLSKISVEPTVFLTIFTSMMYQLICQNLYLEKACRVNVGFSSSVCDALKVRNASGYSKDEEVEVQKLVARMLGLRTVLQSLFPFCLMLFVGSWTDRYKRRKPVILAPIIGEIFCCIFLILNVIYFHELPLIYTTLGDSLPLALLGGWPCFLVGIYTYIGEKCNHQNRTIRMGILTAEQMIALCLGMGAAGIIYESTGFIGFFVVCIFLLILAFLFGMILVKEEKIKSSYKHEDGFLIDFFNIKHFVDSLKVCFRKGRNNKRTKIIIIMIMMFVIMGCVNGEIAVNYLYTRLKFGWNSTQYGIFASTMSFVDTTGTILAVIFFSKYLGYDDSFLGILGLTGSVIANVVYAFAPNGFIFYFGILCDFCRLTTYIAMRSIMSKIVPPDELGQSNSVFGVIESITPLIFGPLYTTIYNHTINYFPGMYFIATITMKFVGLCLFIVLYLMALKEKRSDIKAQENSLSCNHSPEVDLERETSILMTNNHIKIENKLV